MDLSFLHRAKQFLQSYLPFSSDVILIFLGLGCYLLSCLVLRRPLSWAWALVPGLLLAVLLEGLEILDHYGLMGLGGLAPGELAAVLGRHFKDVIVMNLAPAMVVLAATFLQPPASN